MREGVTLKDLHELATALTDVQAAEELNEAATRCSGACLRARPEIDGAGGATAGAVAHAATLVLRRARGGQPRCPHHKGVDSPLADASGRRG